MSPEKDAELVRKYPMLYAQREGRMSETCMCWGFECDDGWYSLIDELSARLEGLNREIASGGGLPIEACQVKEKFGTLRFYTDAVPGEHSDQVEKWIEEAEEKSARTCEHCGNPGKTRGGGWIMTLCEDCAKERR